MNSIEIKNMLPRKTSKLDRILRLSDAALRKASRIAADEKSKMRMPFSDDKKLDKSDIVALIHNFPSVVRTMRSYFSSVKLDKKRPVASKSKLIEQDYAELAVLLKQCGIVSVGCVEVQPKHVFAGMAVPYPHAIVLSAKQDRDIILSSPSADSQMEVMRVYGVSGVAANKAATLLTEHGYAAVPGHSLGGSVDYCLLGKDANLGMIGKHGMLITPESGANHRMSVVFTSIPNLRDFIQNEGDHSWIVDFCGKCKKCMRKCLGGAILEKNEQDELGNVKSIDYFRCIGHFASKHGCNVCIKECPFTTVGYEKLHTQYISTMKKATD